MSDLPKGWQLLQGKDLFDIVRGVTFRKSDASPNKTENSICVLRAGNLQNGEILEDDLLYVDTSYVKDQQALQKGDLIVAMSSGSKTVVGKIAIVRKNMPEYSFGAFCGVIRPKQEDLQAWIRKYFSTREYREIISNKAVGVNINNLKPAYLNELIIAVPPVKQLEILVAKLDKCQQRIEDSSEALAAIPELLENYRSSLLAAAFRGDLTKAWRAEQKAKGIQQESAQDLLNRLRQQRQQQWQQSELQKYEAKGKTPPKGWEKKYKKHSIRIKLRSNLFIISNIANKKHTGNDLLYLT